MSIIDRLSSSLGRRDGVPNQELAQELAETENKNHIKELVRNLSNRNKAIQSDCIKTLYEIGFIKPGLISSYVIDLCNLLRSKNNRLIWGAMMALSTIAPIEFNRIFERIEMVIEAIEKGSVITVDNGVSVLAKVSSMKKAYEKKIFPYLLRHLETCRPKELGQHAEKILISIRTFLKSSLF